MDDDRMVKSAWTPEVRMHAIIFFVFMRAVARSRTRARTTGGGEGETTHRWRNDPRGTGTCARGDVARDIRDDDDG